MAWCLEGSLGLLSLLFKKELVHRLFSNSLNSQKYQMIATNETTGRCPGSPFFLSTVVRSLYKRNCPGSYEAECLKRELELAQFSHETQTVDLYTILFFCFDIATNWFSKDTRSLHKLCGWRLMAFCRGGTGYLRFGSHFGWPKQCP